jgi:mRNA interferase MazF
MTAISLKLPDDVLETSTKCATTLNLSRTAYIRRAIEHMNKQTQMMLRANGLPRPQKKFARKVCASIVSFPPLSTIQMPNRGEVWLANLHSKHGTEPGKTRPVLIAQAQALLDSGHPSTVIIPLTTNLVDDAEPLRIRVTASGSFKKQSDLLIDQVQAIDNLRLVSGPLTRLSSDVMERVGEAMKEVLDLDHFSS